MSSLHPNAPQCHHVHTNGLRCGSPAIRKQTFCYYHHKAKNQRDWVRAELPELEDGTAIQLGIAKIMRLVMTGAIEYRAAQLMIDSFRLALRNLKNVNAEPCWKKDIITVDPHYDAANAGLVEEPVTYKQQEELAARGAFSEEAKAVPTPNEPESPKDDMKIARHEMPGRKESSEASLLPQAGLRSDSGAQIELGKRETGNGKPDEAEPPDFDTLSEAEQEALVMRLTGNKAYFMKEEEMPPAPEPSKVELKELIEELRKEVG